MADKLCENKYCLMDQEESRRRISMLTFENRQLRRIVEVLMEPFAYYEEMLIEDAFRKSEESNNDHSAPRTP